MEVSELRQQLEASRKELHSARCALKDVTNERMIQKKRDIAEKKAAMLQELQGSLEEVAQLHVDLSLAISEVENELESIFADCTTMHAVSDEDFVIQTKCGRRY